MAEERAPEAAAEVAAAAPSKKKKKKKHGKISLLFWLILLGVGTAVGLHLSGYWDGRPLFWSIIPKIPYVGQPLAEFFKIPEQYSLTVSERRAIELMEWQRRLDERERTLTDRSFNLDTLSDDLGTRITEVQRREGLVAEAEEIAASGGKPTQSEQDLMNQVAHTYQDMSARNAAAIVEQLRENLAVELLLKLPNEARASILGKMKPQRAARLTELMARPK
ncbi:MAG: MgtE intracellular region [Fretibacterium sp.]|nr:MgtE intracellular region [Fretibacterium sp.]